MDSAGARHSADTVDGASGAKKLGEGHEHGKRHGHRGKRFERADKNGDGFLTQDEVGAKRWDRIKVADANSDARVSKDEMKAAREAGKLGHEGKHRKGRKGRKDHKDHESDERDPGEKS